MTRLISVCTESRSRVPSSQRGRAGAAMGSRVVRVGRTRARRGRRRLHACDAPGVHAREERQPHDVCRRARGHGVDDARRGARNAHHVVPHAHTVARADAPLEELRAAAQRERALPRRCGGGRRRSYESTPTRRAGTCSRRLTPSSTPPPRCRVEWRATRLPLLDPRTSFSTPSQLEQTRPHSAHFFG